MGAPMRARGVSYPGNQNNISFPNIAGLIGFIIGGAMNDF